MFVFLQNRKEILIPTHCGFFWFCFSLSPAQKGSLWVCLPPFPFFLSCFQSQNCLPRSNLFPCRFRVLGGSNFFSHHNWTQLDKWFLITFLFKICEALHDFVSKLSISQSIFFSLFINHVSGQRHRSATHSLRMLCLPSTLRVRSKPPLSSGLVSLCAAELGVDGPIVAKVVFSWYRSSLHAFKLTMSGWTVNMKSACIIDLPERSRQMRTHVSPDIDVFHFLTRAWSKEIYDVEVFEVSTEVVSEIDAVGWVAACCSPVGGVSL